MRPYERRPFLKGSKLTNISRGQLTIAATNWYEVRSPWSILLEAIGAKTCVIWKWGLSLRLLRGIAWHIPLVSKPTTRNKFPIWSQIAQMKMESIMRPFWGITWRPFIRKLMDWLPIRRFFWLAGKKPTSIPLNSSMAQWESKSSKKSPAWSLNTSACLTQSRTRPIRFADRRVPRQLQMIAHPTRWK